MEGNTCIDLAKVVISASKVDVRSHMSVLIVVILTWGAGGTNNVSAGSRGWPCWETQSNNIKLWRYAFGNCSLRSSTADWISSPLLFCTGSGEVASWPSASARD
jgi:hypothetical protein